MIEINLLPKGYRKGSHQFSLGKAGKYGLVSAVAVIVVMAGITFFQVRQLRQLEENIARADQRATLLRKDIRVVDALSDVKNKITWRMTAVEELDRHRSAWVSILQDLAGNIPEFVWLAALREIEVEPPKKATDSAAASTEPVQATGKVRPIEVEGFAFTLNSLAAFMIKMMRSDYFDDVELVAANQVGFDENGKVMQNAAPTQAKGRNAYQFTLSCKVHYLSEEELRTLIASASQSGQPGSSTTGHQQLN